ncbi:type II toxin-antitoxin system RelE/ParE family toxin [Bartonella ancashensis]|uniref:HigB toxin protein n=1 Tax=Bartonella ancashensis TaxID=1318743 RepID=A0A0M4L7Z1_9HYPH|nr:HigB toxin protein [Bartonella ancashensis]
MIESFAGKRCKDLLEGNPPKSFPVSLVRTAQRKLFMLDKAVELEGLRSPLGNRLEALKSDRQGQYSIRTNDQSYHSEWQNRTAFEKNITN